MSININVMKRKAKKIVTVKGNPEKIGTSLVINKVYFTIPP